MSSVEGETEGEGVEYPKLFLRQAVVRAGPSVFGSGLGLHFLKDKEGAGLFLVEFFSIDLGGSPESGRRPGREGRGDSSADGWVEGVRVKSGKAAANFASLWFKVLAPPHNVFKITWGVSTVITDGGNSIVQLRELDLS